MCARAMSIVQSSVFFLWPPFVMLEGQKHFTNTACVSTWLWWYCKSGICSIILHLHHDLTMLLSVLAPAYYLSQMFYNFKNIRRLRETDCTFQSVSVLLYNHQTVLLSRNLSPSRCRRMLRLSSGVHLLAKVCVGQRHAGKITMGTTLRRNWQTVQDK